jgi:transposase
VLKEISRLNRLTGSRRYPYLRVNQVSTKFADYLPLHQQSQIYGREDDHLNRSTFTDWVGCSAALPAPLAYAIGRHVMAVASLRW